jgi:hypothetical protein
MIKDIFKKNNSFGWVDTFNKDFLNIFLSKDFMFGKHNAYQHKEDVITNPPNTETLVLCPDCIDHGCGSSNKERNNYPDENIKYSFNNESYRCDNFNLEKTNNNFLFSGCSYTFGSGLPYNGTWAYQLNKDLSGDQFYNLGLNANSQKSIIYDVYNYIRKYGKPKAVFILFPDISRVIGFVDSLSSIEVKTRLLNEEYPNESSRFFTQDLLYFDFYNSICALEDYLKSINVPFLWGTWHQETEKVLNLVSKNFNNYVKIFTNPSSAKYFKDVKLESNMSNRYWDRSRDVTHPGIKTQMIIKNIFLDEWKKNNENV